MKAKTKLLLYYLLWTVETAMRPTLRNLTNSFEEWAYGAGFWREIARLEHEGLLERKPATVERIYRLTERGRIQSLGGRDPESSWQRKWDGQWRLVLFDIPQRHHTARTKLTRLLRESAFGCLQRSVWISADPISGILEKVSGAGNDVGSFLTLHALPASGEADSAIVAKAWNFAKINTAYARCLAVLKEASVLADRVALRKWAEKEQRAWLEAISLDPLLPEVLLPADYAGKRVWQVRQKTLAQAYRRLSSG